MALVYAYLICAGKFLFKNVLPVFKADTKLALEDMGAGHLAIEE